MRTRRHRLVAAVSALALLLSTGGCAFGGGNNKSTRSFKSRPTTGLASRLEAPPKLSAPGSSRWANDYSPSIGMFVEQFYGAPVRDKVTKMLTAQGLQHVAHILWITDDRIQNDLVVLQFRTSSGAEDRLNTVDAINQSDKSQTSYSLDSLGAPTVYVRTAPDSRGYTDVKAYARLDNYVVEMFVNSPSGPSKLLVERWLKAQIALL